MNSRWLPFEWIAAVRFLGEGRLQTAFIVGGISIGVAVIVFMSAMLAGLEANFINRVLTSQSHIQLIPPDQVSRPLRGGAQNSRTRRCERPSQRIVSIDQWPKVVARLKAMPEVVAVSPTMSGSALAVRGQASRAITLAGVEPADLFTNRAPARLHRPGQATLTSEDIIVGTELAKNLGATVGDKINVQAASGASLALRIIGIFDLGNKGVNQRNAYVALRTAQALVGMIGGVTAIETTVTDIYAAEDLAQQIQAANYVEADSWIATNAQFFTAVHAQETSNTLIRVFVALSVAFGIAAVLVVSVIQRSKDIGILRAMGASRGQIQRVFLIQGAVLAFIGSLIGSALGAGALIYWHAMARQVDGTELFPLILERQLFVYTAILATLTGLVAAVAPALARRPARSGGGDPWLTRSCASKESARTTTSACPRKRGRLHDIDLELKRGEFLALIGPSGSGKSTLLNIIGLLDRPTEGKLFIKGEDVGGLDDAAAHAPARAHDRLRVSVSHADLRFHGGRKRDDADARRPRLSQRGDESARRRTDRRWSACELQEQSCAQHVRRPAAARRGRARARHESRPRSRRRTDRQSRHQIGRRRLRVVARRQREERRDIPHRHA